MLRQLRTVRAAQIALCLAAIVAVGGSFGLHPEPGSGAVSIHASGFSTFKTSPAPHGCLACLAHGAALVPPISGILLTSSPAATASVFLEPALAGRLAGRDLSGRSPPARS
jgi:hypothetical protein